MSTLEKERTLCRAARARAAAAGVLRRVRPAAPRATAAHDRASLPAARRATRLVGELGPARAPRPRRRDPRHGGRDRDLGQHEQAGGRSSTATGGSLTVTDARRRDRSRAADGDDGARRHDGAARDDRAARPPRGTEIDQWPPGPRLDDRASFRPAGGRSPGGGRQCRGGPQRRAAARRHPQLVALREPQARLLRRLPRRLRLRAGGDEACSGPAACSAWPTCARSHPSRLDKQDWHVRMRKRTAQQTACSVSLSALTRISSRLCNTSGSPYTFGCGGEFVHFRLERDFRGAMTAQMEAQLAQLQACMYQYSRAIYRSIKDLIDPYSDACHPTLVEACGAGAVRADDGTPRRRPALFRLARPRAFPGHPPLFSDHRAGAGRLGGA